MSETPETAHHLPSGPAGSELPSLSELQQKAALISGEYFSAMQRHEQVEHLAGLSAHAIAQELIDHFGADTVLQAIAQVRQKGKVFFFDLICVLLPKRSERLAFYEQILSEISERRINEAKQHGQEGNEPNRSVERQRTDGQKERYLHFCQECDGATHLVPIVALPLFRDLYLKTKKKMLADEEDGNFLAHHHFSSLPEAFDPSQYTEELAASGNQLSRLHEVENERLTQTVTRIEQHCAALRARITGMMGVIHSEVATAWAPRIEAIQKDLTQFEQAINPLQSPEVQKITQGTLRALHILLKETIAARDAVVKERGSPFTAILRSLPPIPPAALAPGATASGATGRIGQNGKAGRNGKKNGTGAGNHSTVTSPGA